MENLEHLRGWVGRKERREDVIHSWPITALAATLDQADIATERGTPIPHGWHWLFFLEAKPASQLGVDGHPKKGGFLPPVPLPRRMWAGGRVQFMRPVPIGQAVARDSEILSVEPKSGRSGTLVFVTVRHTVSVNDEAAIVEEQDIVYREAVKPGDAPPPGKPAPEAAQWRQQVVPNPVLLFRFSALTFNGHRIHYDLNYAKNEEHYPALVVHGPLQTILLLNLCRTNRRNKSLRKLDYRAMSPIFHTDPFTVNGNPDPAGEQVQLWTAGSKGQMAMTATASY